MQNNSNDETVFLHLGFQFPDKHHEIVTIEIIGVLGKKSKAGDIYVTDKMKGFFNDLIVNEINKSHRSIRDFSFRKITIWLHDTNSENKTNSYEIPTIKPDDIKITSSHKSSKLQHIYILKENGGAIVDQKFESSTRNLFKSIFKNFVALPEINDTIKAPVFSQILRPFISITESIDKYHAMKQHLYFNSLIIKVS